MECNGYQLTAALTAAVSVSGASATGITIPLRDGMRPVLLGVSAYPGAANQNAVLCKETDASGAVLASTPSLTSAGNIPWVDCFIVGTKSLALYVALETPQSGTNRVTITYAYAHG